MAGSVKSLGRVASVRPRPLAWLPLANLKLRIFGRVDRFSIQRDRSSFNRNFKEMDRRVSLGFIASYWVVLGFGVLFFYDFLRVVLDFTGFYWVLRGFTGFWCWLVVCT